MTNEIYEIYERYENMKYMNVWNICIYNHISSFSNQRTAKSAYVVQVYNFL